MTLPRLQQELIQNIRQIPDYPKKGILFQDITTILAHSKAFSNCIEFLKNRYESYKLTHIVGIESRGFIFGATLAYALDIGFIPVRKKGKLPFKTYAQDYELEYGTDSLEIHIDAFGNTQNPRVLLIDDLLATGGTACASLELIKRAGGECVESCFLIRLRDLQGDKNLSVPSFYILDL